MMNLSRLANRTCIAIVAAFGLFLIWEVLAR